MRGRWVARHARPCPGLGRSSRGNAKARQVIPATYRALQCLIRSPEFDRKTIRSKPLAWQAARPELIQSGFLGGESSSYRPLRAHSEDVDPLHPTRNALPADGAGEGHDVSDHPIGFHWRTLDLAAFDDLGLPPARSKAEQEARSSILTEAYLIGVDDPNGWISYSRNKTWYSAAPRYRGTAYTYRTVTGSVDTLASAGLIEHNKAPAGTYRKVQSTFRASPSLLRAFGNAPLPVVYDPAEIVVLRNANGAPVEYRDTPETRRIRRNLDIINEAIGVAAVAHPDLGAVVDGAPVRLGKANPGPAKRKLHRVFTGGWDRHGRFYGPWWQNIPKGERARLTLHGEPIFEADYPRLHITLAYADAGVALEGDPYEVGAWPAPLVKVAVNIILNARDRLSAVRAVAGKIGGQGAFETARMLLEAIERRHAPIEDWFYSNAGLRLMHTDSQMAEGVLFSLIKRGLIALPLHDGFMVEDRRRGDILEAMAAQLHRAVNQGVSHCNGAEIPSLVLHMVPPSFSPPWSWWFSLPRMMARASCSVRLRLSACPLAMCSGGVVVWRPSACERLCGAKSGGAAFLKTTLPGGLVYRALNS